MGAILAKFRKEKSTDEVLEGLEEKIKQIEKYTLNTQEQKRRIVGNFLATSIGIYVIAFIVFYFVYFPPTWRERIIYSVPLFLFPFVIIFLRRLFTWYFERKLNKNSNKLTALHEEKKKILEQVMDKETYKVAVKLLARYGSQKSMNVLTPRVPPAGNLNIATQRLAIVPSPNAPANASSLQDLRLRAPLNTASLSLTPRQRISSSPAATGVPAPTGQALIPRASLSITPQRRPVGGALAGQELRRRTPFPVVNQQAKGVLERIVDVLIGDGPKDRFAMICKDCYSHNGMALREDFDYTTFRCAFCNVLNPARKARPIAPRLPEQNFLHHKRGSNSSSSSPTDIDSENDEPVAPMSTTGSAAVTPRIQLTVATNTPVKAAAAAVPAAFDKLNALGVMQRQPEIGGGDAPGALSENAADAAGNEEEQQLEREKGEEQQLEREKEEEQQQETVTAKVVANLQALHATEDDELSRLQERFAQMYATDDVGAEQQQQQLRAVETDADKQLRDLEQAEQLDELKKSK